MIDLSNYNIYQNKDGRMRAYNKTTHAVTSYPRLIAELVFGIKLKKTDDVHHKDGNPLNNDPSNLEIIDHKEHERKHNGNGFGRGKRKYNDKILVCPVCKKSFTWTSKQQSAYYHKSRATKNTRKFDRQPPCCCKRCAGKYAAMIQYNNNDLEGDLKPKKKTCPICGKEFIWQQTSQWRFKHGMNEIPKPCCSMSCIHALRKQIKQNTD